MTVAVCLQTCDRVDYTRRTLETFLEHNPDRSRFVLLHGDDGSSDPRNLELAAAAGFQTVVRHTVRCGYLATRHALIEAAAHFAEWMLLLENDQASIRPFPWAAFDFVQTHRRVYCLRLFGRYKDAEQLQPCKVTHQWRRQRRVRWIPLAGAPEPLEVGSIHWTAQPCVTRTKSAIALHRKGKRELGLTARVVTNVMVHIGATRTAEVVPC